MEALRRQPLGRRGELSRLSPLKAQSPVLPLIWNCLIPYHSGSTVNWPHGFPSLNPVTTRNHQASRLSFHGEDCSGSTFAALDPRQPLSRVERRPKTDGPSEVLCGASLGLKYALWPVCAGYHWPHHFTVLRGPDTCNCVQRGRHAKDT